MFKRHLLTEEQLQSNGFPRPYPERKGSAIFYTPTKNPVQSRGTKNYQCGRCSKTFRVDDNGRPLLKENCIYHAKKKFANRSGYRYGCCGVEGDSDGCLLADTHIINGFVFEKSACGKHRIQDGYVQTFGKSNSKSNTSIYALDCEMCFTTHGVELIRVTVVNYKKKPVYERFVKPPHEILDYITEFSGVTAKDMIGQNTTLEDVQVDLMKLFSERTILVGHSLDSDLSALKIIHSAVVDTSVSFPHSRGPPYKRSLKTLAGTYLSKIIQQNNDPLKVGHDSEEDAVVSLELMLHLIKEDLKSYID